MTNFPKKCIKCKKTDVPLKEFVYARSIMSQRLKTAYVKVPVCDTCKKELIKYEKRLKYFKYKYCLLCIFCISTFLPSAWTSYNPRITPTIIFGTIILSIISGILTATLFILHIIFNRKNQDNINNYIEINMDGSIVIKDPEYRKEFEELAKSELSKEDELYNCPSCNTLVMIDMEFCHVCGMDLTKIRD